MSTIHTYPSSPSIVEHQQVIDQESSDEPIIIENNQITDQTNNKHNEINQPTHIHIPKEQSEQSNQVNIEYLK